MSSKIAEADAGIHSLAMAVAVGCFKAAIDSSGALISSTACD